MTRKTTVKKTVAKKTAVRKPATTTPVVRPASLTSGGDQPTKSSFYGKVKDNIAEQLEDKRAFVIQGALETAGDAGVAGSTARWAAAAKRRADIKALGAGTSPGQTYRGAARPRPAVPVSETWRGQPRTDLGSHVTASRAAGGASRTAARLGRVARVAGKVPVLGTALTGVSIGLDVHNGAPVDRAVVSGLAGFGAAVGTGALIGSAIPVPVVGTVAGAVGGAVVGVITSGLVDAAYDPVKDWAVDGAGAVGDAAQSVGGTLADGAGSVGGFLNPFD